MSARPPSAEATALPRDPGSPSGAWLGHAAIAACYGATLELVLTTVAVPLVISDLGGLALFWLGSVAYLAPICLATGIAARWLEPRCSRWYGTVALPLASSLIVGSIVALGIHKLRGIVAARDLQFPVEVSHLETVGVFGMVAVGLLAFHWLQPVLRRLRITPTTERRLLGILFASVGLVGMSASFTPLASLHLLTSALIAGLVGMVCSTVAAGLLLPPAQGRLGVALGALVLLPSLLLPLRGASAAHASYVRYAHAPLSGGLAALLRVVADRDGDGAASTFLGGTDCGEFDASRGPGVREIPGDHIDQDCRGGDSSQQQEPLEGPVIPTECRIPDEKLSVLLITIDAMRADVLGPENTPHLFELARNSLAFSRAYAPSTMTNISMAAVFSGRPYADLVANAARVPELFGSVPSLVPLLREAGVETVAFNRLALDPALTKGFTEINPLPMDIRHDFDSRPLDSAAQSNGVLQWLERGERQRFIWVHYADAHAPYRVPAIFENGPTGYPAGFRYIDQQLGYLLTELSTRKQLGRYVVAVTADHGEELGDRMQEGHGANLFEESIHVPLLLWIPGCKPRVDPVPVSLTRLMPSLAGLLGVRVPRPGLWTPSTPDSLPVVVEEGTAVSHTFKRAILLNDDKMIVDVRSGGRVLFNLRADPAEFDNLYPSHAEVAERLELAYQRWLDAPGRR